MGRRLHYWNEGGSYYSIRKSPTTGRLVVVKQLHIVGSHLAKGDYQDGNYFHTRKKALAVLWAVKYTLLANQPEAAQKGAVR